MIPQIYVAGRYSSDKAYEVEQNINRAWDWGLRIVRELKAWPMGPHLCGQHMEGAASNEFFYEATLEMMRRCDAVFLMPGWEESTGARGEKAEAERLGIPVFTIFGDLAEWIKEQSEPKWIECTQEEVYKAYQEGKKIQVQYFIFSTFYWKDAYIKANTYFHLSENNERIVTRVDRKWRYFAQ